MSHGACLEVSTLSSRLSKKSRYRHWGGLGETLTGRVSRAGMQSTIPAALIQGTNVCRMLCFKLAVLQDHQGGRIPPLS